MPMIDLAKERSTIKIQQFYFLLGAIVLAAAVITIILRYDQLYMIDPLTASITHYSPQAFIAYFVPFMILTIAIGITVFLTWADGRRAQFWGIVLNTADGVRSRHFSPRWLHAVALSGRGNVAVHPWRNQCKGESFWADQ